MSSKFIRDTSTYRMPKILYLVRWITSTGIKMKKPYLQKAAAVNYWERRIKYTDTPCWIETFELQLTTEDFYGQKIPETHLDAIR